MLIKTSEKRHLIFANKINLTIHYELLIISYYTSISRSYLTTMSWSSIKPQWDQNDPSLSSSDNWINDKWFIKPVNIK